MPIFFFSSFSVVKLQKWVEERNNDDDNDNDENTTKDTGPGQKRRKSWSHWAARWQGKDYAFFPLVAIDQKVVTVWQRAAWGTNKGG